MTEECAGALAGADARIKDLMTAAPVIGADETGLRVAGEICWVHVTRTESLTHYACRPKRGKEAMDAIGILPAYTGTVVSDALGAYRQYRQSRHALCGAHLLRELTDIKETCAEQQWTEPLRSSSWRSRPRARRCAPPAGARSERGSGRSSSAATTGS